MSTSRRWLLYAAIALGVVVILIGALLVVNRPAKHGGTTTGAQPVPQQRLTLPVPLMHFLVEPRRGTSDRNRIDHRKKVTRDIGYPRTHTHKRVNGGCDGKETIQFAMNVFNQTLWREHTSIHWCWATSPAPGDFTYFGFNRWWDKGDLGSWTNGWQLSSWGDTVQGSGIGGTGWWYRYRRQPATLSSCWLGACFFTDHPWTSMTVRANGTFVDDIGF